MIIVFIILVLIAGVELALLTREHFWLKERINFETQINDKLSKRLDEEIELNGKLNEDFNKMYHKQLKIEEEVIKILKRSK